MTAFRSLLVVLWAVIALYTGVVIARHGMGLFPVFFGDIAAMGWPGQFNVDFTSLLTLSAVWVAWRNRFSATGLGLGVLAFFGGGLFLTTYLLVLSARCGSDVEALLLGTSRRPSTRA